jgi:hypothetical protein
MKFPKRLDCAKNKSNYYLPFSLFSDFRTMLERDSDMTNPVLTNSSFTNFEIESPQNDQRKKKNKRTLIASSIYSRNMMISTEAYEKLMGRERPIAILVFVIFILASPFVFRYAMASNTTNTTQSYTLSTLGNATMSMEMDWSQCENCVDIQGVTVGNLLVNIDNVTNPNFHTGFPSIAVFASQDLKNW